jgi:squalene synthase HpnC
MREAVVAIYHFARTADDIADEGDQEPDQRLCELKAYRLALEDTLQGRQRRDPDAPWSDIFRMLAIAHAKHHLPSAPLHDLLDAFEQDVRNPAYTSRDELLDYCRRSANPIGRLLLHLHGVNGEALITMSDKVCSALQLINFWQDLSIDLPRGRVYIPKQDAAAHGIHWPPGAGRPSGTQCERALVAELCDWASATMHEGAMLPLEIGGRLGLELRLVVQGGLRILERIRRMDYQTFHSRPVLSAADVPTLLWRALSMRRAFGPAR